MAREQFAYSASRSLFKSLEQLSQRSATSRGAAFEDWLTVIVCALAAETKEDEYLATVERHKTGKPGNRSVDLMGQMFGELVAAMDESHADILGDLFQGAITYGEAGQYFTPESIARLMAELTIDPHAAHAESNPILIQDPCCGTGRMLLEAAAVNPTAELFGQDIDARCAKITAINLGLRGHYGWVLCGNSLLGETQFAYRIGSFFNETPQGLRRGVIRDVPPKQPPVPVIAERFRNQAAELLRADPLDGTPPAITPKIIEVPQWLARLEPGLAAAEPRAPDPATQQTPSAPDDSLRRQQTLF